MNDENHELLCAYIDGLLPAAERSALEARLAASAELRRELDELRAVTKALKDLPKEPLPAGFMARLQARRARGDEPAKNWVFLPPNLRPVALALSCGVVALVIWDKVAVTPEVSPLHPAVSAKVVAAGDAPVAQFDVSRQIAAGAAGSSATNAAAKSLGYDGVVPEPVRRGDSAPALAEGALQDKKELASADAAPAAPAAAPAPSFKGMASTAGAVRGRAAGRPLDGASGGGAALADRGATSMTEEERSARNEQMFHYIESEKKKMGIARVLEKDEANAPARMAALGAASERAAPKISAASPNLLKKTSLSMPASEPAPGKADALGGRLSPDAGLVFTDARSLASSWVLLGFPGEPPSMDFASGRLVLIKPSATKILSVAAGKDAVTVTYRALTAEETPEPARDRVAPIPAEPRPVLILDVTPQ